MSYDFEESSNQRIDDYPSHADYTSTVSCSFWLKAESNPGSHQAIFVSKDKDGANEPNVRFLWTPAGGGEVYVAAYAGGGFNEWKTTYSPTTGAWEHWYFEVDWTTNPDTVLFWVNGVSKTMTHNYGSNNITPSTTATQTITLGGSQAGNENHADGLLAEVALWSDIVGSTRASGLYNSGSGGEASTLYPTNLIEYIPLVSGIANTAGGSGTLTASPPTLSSDHPFITGSVLTTVTADSSTVTNPNVTTSYGMVVSPTADSVGITSPTQTVLMGTIFSVDPDYVTFSSPTVTVPEIINVTVSSVVDSVLTYSPSVFALVRPTPWEAAGVIQTAWASSSQDESIWTPGANIETSWRAND